MIHTCLFIPIELNPLVRMDVTLVVHASSSLLQQAEFKVFLKDFVRDFHIAQDATRLALVVFSNRARVVFDFNRYDNVMQIEVVIDQLQFNGRGTNIIDGLRKARELYRPNLGDRADAANLVYLFVGDSSLVSLSAIRTEANLLKMRNTLIGVMSIGFNQASREQLTASAWDQRFVRKAPRVTDLNSAGIRRVSYSLVGGECFCHVTPGRDEFVRKRFLQNLVTVAKQICSSAKPAISFFLYSRLSHCYQSSCTTSSITSCQPAELNPTSFHPTHS